MKIDELSQGVDVMTDAFFNDSLWLYLYPKEEKRKKYLQRFFKSMLSLSINKKEAYCIGNPVIGVAIWDIPYNSKEKITLETLNSLSRLMLTPFIFSMFKVTNIFDTIEKLRNKYAKSHYYYLQGIGIMPSFQEKGYCSKLIEPFIKAAKDKNMGVYTETMTFKNVALYEHYGLKAMEECSMKDNNLKIWSLYMDNNKKE